MKADPARVRSVQWRLFVAAWMAYAFFHQGGGWNQNARFAMTRAVVEQGRFAIDSYMFYSSAEPRDGAEVLVRTPVVDGRFRLHGGEFVVTWPGPDSLPVAGDPGPHSLVKLDRFAPSGDLAFARGHFFPNQAPGTGLLALPAYFLLYQVERLTGLDPDAWWVLTVNAWLTTALSLGLLSALGAIAFLRVALVLAEGRLHPAVWATVTFAFGTLFFPYSTMLFEHNVVATTLLIAFALLLTDGPAGELPTRRSLVLAGVAAGWAVISAFSAAVPVILLAAWLAARTKRPAGLLWFAVGLALPLAVLVGYNLACFGSPLTSSLDFQNPRLSAAGHLGWPQLDRLLAVLVSPFRGLFVSSPVLVLGAAGLVTLLRGRGRRAEGALFVALFAFFWLLNGASSGWHGGRGVGPRYLVPALPFLALPLVECFRRLPRLSSTLAALSIVIVTLVTVVDPQSPVGTSPVAASPGQPLLLRSPLTEYLLPLFATGRAGPIVRAQIEDRLRRTEQELIAEGVPEPDRESRLAEFRERLESLAADGSPEIAMSAFRGPVSANPVGVYEGWIGQLFKPPEPELEWHSFNAGELLLPRSRLSVLFLLLLAFPLVAGAVGMAREADVAPATDTAKNLM